MMRPMSEETRAKLRAARLGKPRPDMLKANAGPRTIHTWLRKWHPLTGICDKCGRPAKTEFAYRYHPKPYTRERSDYRELCRSCHVKMDGRPMTPEIRKKIADSKRGSRASEETRRKMSLARKGKKRPPFSDEWKANISKGKMGSTPWNKGMKMSDEYRAMLSEAHKRPKS